MLFGIIHEHALIGDFLFCSTEAQKLKINDRRSAGLVPYPRIGRNSEMANLPRSERALGMIHQPRVGRSDVPSSGNLNRLRDLSADDIDFYATHEVDPDLLDLDYEGIEIETIFKRYFVILEFF
jgi:hypothetical protein